MKCTECGNEMDVYKGEYAEEGTTDYPGSPGFGPSYYCEDCDITVEITQDNHNPHIYDGVLTNCQICEYHPGET